MATITINLQEPYRFLVLTGKKTIEGRLNKGKFAAIKIGDIFEVKPELIRFRVIGKNNYPSFKDMLANEGLKNVVPDKKNMVEALKVYRKYFSKEQEKKFGVVAFKLIQIEKK